nr:MAG TPA: tail assembly chaperone protein [Caudoviricetes sp.]
MGLCGPWPISEKREEDAVKSAMQEIEYKGKSYKLVFDLNVMEAIQDEYGSIDAWGKLTEPDDGEPNIKALVFGVTEMINEGIDIDNDENGTDEKPLSHKQVARILTEVGLESVADKMQKSVIDSTADDSKNA